jgi:hypothetical protein
MPPTDETEVAMIAVIFEVFPADGHKDDYLEHAARLRGELECMDGFISVERFQSLTDPDKLLSLSFWRDGANALSTFVGYARADDARLCALSRTLRQRHRRPDCHERYRCFRCHSPDPACMARHPFCLNACQPQPGAELRPFWPHRTWPAAGLASAVLLKGEPVQVNGVWRIRVFGDWQPETEMLNLHFVAESVVGQNAKSPDVSGTSALIQ